MRVGPQLVRARRAVKERRRTADRESRPAGGAGGDEAEARRAVDAIAERGGGELAATDDEMLVGIDRVMDVVQQRGDRLADARAVRAVPHAARHARDQRALDLLLQVEHGRVFVASQRIGGTRATSRHVDAANGRCRQWRSATGTMRRTPGCSSSKRDESALGDPVDRELRPVRADVGDDRERMDDVAERRGAHDEDRGSRCLAARARRRDGARAAVAPRVQPRSRGVRHGSTRRQDSGETS